VEELVVSPENAHLPASAELVPSTSGEPDTTLEDAAQSRSEEPAIIPESDSQPITPAADSDMMKEINTISEGNIQCSLDEAELQAEKGQGTPSESAVQPAEGETNLTSDLVETSEPNPVPPLWTIREKKS
jgi:hypothetical protein